ncbi:MAG: hypothetical protein AAF787_15460 [Chloroflexota bacterium]
MVARALRRSVWLPVALLLMVVAALYTGRSRPDMNIAYNGTCGGRTGTCIYDAYTGQMRYHSALLGVSWTPDMRRAAETDQGRLFILRPDGTPIRTIVDNGQYFAGPQWAPGGRYLIYEAADRTGDALAYNLWLTDVRGEERTVLLPLPGPTSGRGGAWAPDGERFVYFIGEEVYLCAVARAACQLTALTDNPVAHWSPDGEWVVFSPGADRVQVLDGRTGETVLRETLFPDSRDSLLLRPLWLDDNTLMFTHGLNGTPYTLRLDDPTPRAISTDSPTLAHLIPTQNLTMEAIVYHFGHLEPETVLVEQLSPIGNTVPPSLMLDGQNNGYYIGVPRW